MDVATHAIRETKVAFDSSFDAKEQVRQAIDIVDLLGKYNLQLRRQGRGYVALCPWHDDTRPSLQVNPERQSWKCWPCDIGGDIFSFVMKMEGVDFPEALAMLADRAGITLQKTARDGPSVAGASDGYPLAGGGIDKRTLYKAAAWVERQYHECLLHSPEAEPARKYFQERGITAESIERFQLGFAPLDRDWILKQAGGSPSRAKVLETIGVLRRSSAGGSLYDLFRGRGLFAIRDAQGRPVGMGGRLLPGVETFLPGKYVNSPETPLFRKSHLLYGLDLAKEAIHKSKQQDRPGDGGLYRRHHRPSVRLQQRRGRARRGVGRNPRQDPEAIRRPHHPRARRRRSRPEAGQRSPGTLRRPAGRSADSHPARRSRPLRFPPAAGAEAFAQLLATGTVDALDHAFRSATRGLDLDRDVHGASQALERLIAILAKAPRLRPDTTSEDRLREEKFLQRFAALFRVSETEVRRRLTALRRRMQDTGKMPSPPDAGKMPSLPAEPAWRPGDAIDACEREFAELLIVYPDTWSAARAAIAPVQLASSALRRIYETGCRLLDVGVLPDFDRLILEFDDPSLKSLLVDLDEQGRAKGSRMAEPAELLSELLKAFQRREVEKQQPGQMVALRERNLAEDQEIDLLKKIVQQERSRQGISDPMDG